MAWRDRADRLNKACLRTYAEDDPVTYTPANGDPAYEVEAHFEAAHRKFDVDGRDWISAERPRAFIVEEYLQNPVQIYDRITVQGRTYSIYDAEPDGYGSIVVWLKEVT